MIAVSIVGASGYSGGELIRLLHFHPHVTIQQVTSERFAGKFVHNAHPNLRQTCRLKFITIGELKPCDLLFLCMPHGETSRRIDHFRGLAPRIIDLSADFRLRNADDYVAWYGRKHDRPELLSEFTYGIPELHRERLRDADSVACAGCNATATILTLHPFFHRELVESAVVEAKAGSSQAGNAANDGSHHPERSGAVRSYKPTGHRHLAEMQQELGKTPISFSATSIEMVRGILITAHLFMKRELTDKDIWRLLRDDYGNEPFIRIVKERSGIHRYPEPKLLSGTNFCDIGFERDPHGNRLVVIGAIDNLMKGAAGQAVQAFNIMHGFDETMALEFPGLHPI